MSVEDSVELKKGICERWGTNPRIAGRVYLGITAALATLPFAGTFLAGLAVSIYNDVQTMRSQMDTAVAYIKNVDDEKKQRDAQIGGMVLAEQRVESGLGDLQNRTALVEGRVGTDETMIRCLQARVSCPWPNEIRSR